MLIDSFLLPKFRVMASKLKTEKLKLPFSPVITIRSMVKGSGVTKIQLQVIRISPGRVMEALTISSAL